MPRTTACYLFKKIHYVAVSRKILDYHSTRSVLWRLKCAKFVFGRGTACPRSRWKEAHNALIPYLLELPTQSAPRPEPHLQCTATLTLTLCIFNGHWRQWLGPPTVHVYPPPVITIRLAETKLCCVERTYCWGKSVDFLIVSVESVPRERVYETWLSNKQLAWLHTLDKHLYMNDDQVDWWPLRGKT